MLDEEDFENYRLGDAERDRNRGGSWHEEEEGVHDPDPTELVDSAEPESVRCERCRKWILEDAEECPYCKHWQGEGDSKPAWLIIAAILLILAFILVLLSGARLW